ncbi:MAG: hypothetical protein RLZZ247_765 [Cyanobacteriota bacterium]
MSPAAAPSHPAPAWLEQRLRAAGGSVPFLTYMQWALHDPQHGAYGSGRLQVGPRGDFATSPSLGPDFAELLAPQLAQWLEALPAQEPLALVEAGPGEGDLALQLAQALQRQWPQLAARTELVLIEPNPGMAARQRARLADAPLPCRWLSFEQLAQQPERGVLLAHEVLDALAVERIEWDGALWRRQRVALHEDPVAGPSLRLEPGEPLEPHMAAQLEPLGLVPAGAQRQSGWCTELHPGLGPWLQQAASALSDGALLVIDYAHDAWRYYGPQRSNGTLMGYRQQQACTDPLLEPGHWDLTAHLCIESLEAAAVAHGWSSLGHRRQGEALLALGLAQHLHGLQQQSGVPLDALLSRREALLRLVDPHALGDFRWLAFQRQGATSLPPALFLQDPPMA